jgi:hypothetical protein
MPDLPSDGCVTVTPRRASEMRAREVKRKLHVRFTPESRHVQRTRPCLLRANSGHQWSETAVPDEILRQGTQRQHHKAHGDHACEADEIDGIKGSPHGADHSLQSRVPLKV